ncbi:MAG: hypothetical protein J6O50_02500 [Ruminiclostridium sp.]|nr:hypothetical protein [Ruminiclostridium sp.]
MKRIKKIIASALLAVFIGLQSVPVYADGSVGDPNIENGGGGLQSGTSSNFWYQTDDGVRVTIVDSKTGEEKSSSIDYTNQHPNDIQFHFGKNSKRDYTGGTALSLSTGSYTYKNPAQSLPKIVGDGEYYVSNIDEIRSYFTDEQVVRAIASDLGFKFDDLINGDYKLMIEPVVYITFNGVRYAMTATEAALLNIQTGGDLINKFGPLSHKNLPLAMFLEDDDLGYTAWSGSTTSRATDSDIINYLGVGIVSFKEPEEEVEVDTSDYEYRVDTDVYTSVTVSGGKHTPDNPVTVIFEIKNTSYTVNNIVYPDGASQLVWVKWHTPTTPQKITIKVTVIGGAETSKGTIIANIVDLDENPPPDPKATDRNDTFSPVSPPNKAQCTTAAWSRYYAYWVPDWVWISNWVWYPHIADGKIVGGHWEDHGHWEDKGDWSFDQNMYSASLNANMTITPDEKNPTKTGRTMKSGYGINERVTATVSGSGEHTDIQNAVTYFPEFKYKKYWRLLEKVSGGYEFKKNEYSTYENKTHFTPVWYPDGSYTPYTWVIDCWTPAGMLSVNLTDSVTIKGNVYDDWHIAKTY